MKCYAFIIAKDKDEKNCKINKRYKHNKFDKK